MKIIMQYLCTNLVHTLILITVGLYLYYPNYQKCCDKIIYGRSLNFLNKSNVLYNRQFGFRKRHNTLHDIAEFVDYILNGYIQL